MSYQCADGRYGGCGRVFGGLTGFDIHRVRVPGPTYATRCMTEVELAASALELKPNGKWCRRGPILADGVSELDAPAGGQYGSGGVPQ